MNDTPEQPQPPAAGGRPASADAAPAPAELGVAQEARESLVEYPSKFPIKVVGVNEDGFVSAITHIARHFDPSFDASTVELRESGGGKYLGVTITVLAVSRTQLDEIYRTLTTHPLVRWVL